MVDWYLVFGANRLIKKHNLCSMFNRYLNMRACAGQRNMLKQTCCTEYSQFNELNLIALTS